MKFTLAAIASVSFLAHAQDEIEKIDSTMGSLPTATSPFGPGCAIKPLNPYMLIEKYDMNISNPEHLYALAEAVTGKLRLGMISQNIAEASDAGRVGILAIDGLAGDANFPHGDIKPLITVGEINMCEANHGEVYVGVPDGMGAYLVDDDTVRLVVQSESYGPLRYESYPYYVNGNGASFTGSHVQYTDFDREALSVFMTHYHPAGSMVKGFGQVATKYYNLKGEPVGLRNEDGPTLYGAHYSNTDVDGNWAVRGVPSKADWLMQSLCSAHLEEAHQWGEGIGLEDDIYITNEEWMSYEDGKEFVGISMHAIDLANAEDYAVGAVTISGFEKIVEINPKSSDFVALALSGYNGAYSGNSAELLARQTEYGLRPDGKNYTWTSNVCPSRIYIGMKGKMEDGSDAPEDDFLARNGLRYGKVYGFAVDMSESGPTGGLWRDAYHKEHDNGDSVDGKFVAIDWQWDGVVKNFRHDGAWDFQLDPPGYENTNMKFWNANGVDGAGSKTEHISPDTREGMSGFIQTSTAGYFGHYYLNDIEEKLAGATEFPTELDSTYFLYQGEKDIRSQIVLNGAGLLNIVEECPGAEDATVNCDNDNSVKNTFEDIDGFEVVAAEEGLFAIIQEDSGNELGERMFITQLEHEQDGKDLTFHFMAQSGGKYNSRFGNGVGIPAGTNRNGGSHEFSGVIDLSGMLAKSESSRARGLQEKKVKGGARKLKEKRGLKKGGNDDDKDDEVVSGSGFMVKSGDGAAKRKAEHMVPINDKYIAVNIQAHNLDGGVVSAFNADRGGQIMVYQPEISVF